MAGRGRGRDLTIPAWMAAQGNGAPTMAPQRPAAVAAPAAVSAPAGISAWTEHTAKDGRKYYYNKTTKQSSWTKPADFHPAATPSAPAAPVATSSSNAMHWKEYTTDKGRKYYHNSATKETTWTMPEEMKAKPATTAPVIQSSPSPSPSPARASPAPAAVAASSAAAAGSKLSYTSKREAIAAFQALLTSADITPETSWDEVLRVIVNDARYSALRTLEEKKSAWSDWTITRRKELRDEARLKERENRTKFLEALQSCDGLTPDMPWRKARSLVETLPGAEGLESDEIRQDVFEEFMYQLLDAKKEKERAARREAMDNLARHLEGCSDITIATTWREAESLLAGNEHFDALEALDRLKVFDSHMRQLEKKHREQEELSYQADRRKQRKNREAFRALISEQIEAGELTAKSHWTPFAETFKEDPRMVAMIGQPGSTPRELFSDAIHALKDALSKDKKTIKELVKENGLTVAESTTPQDIEQLLESHSRKISSSGNIPIVIQEMLDKANKKKEKEKDKDKDKDKERHKDRKKSRDRSRDRSSRRRRSRSEDSEERRKRRHRRRSRSRSGSRSPSRSSKRRDRSRDRKHSDSSPDRDHKRHKRDREERKRERSVSGDENERTQEKAASLEEGQIAE